MAEPLRVFVVQSVQRAEHRIFDHDPVRPWDNPHCHSLPPAPDKPKKPQKPPKVSSLSMRDRPNMALVVTAEGKRKWMLSAEAIAQIRRRIMAREPLWQIAQSMNVAHSKVSRLAKSMREMVVAATEVQSPTAQQAPVMVALAEGLSAPSAIAMAARFAFEVPALPVRITHTAKVSTEPRSGTHVIDWAARLDRIEFDGTPGQGKPKSGKARKCSSTADFRNVYPWPYSHATCLNANPSRAINCAAPEHGPPARGTKSTKKGPKTGKSSNILAGGEAGDIESSWREICTA